MKSIDFGIIDGPRGSLAFDFISHHYAQSEDVAYDRHGPSVFNISEEAFVFIEGTIAAHFDDWNKSYRHWGHTWVSRDTWRVILSTLSSFSACLRSGLRMEQIANEMFPYHRFDKFRGRPDRSNLLAFP